MSERTKNLSSFYDNNTNNNAQMYVVLYTAIILRLFFREARANTACECCVSCNYNMLGSTSGG